MNGSTTCERDRDDRRPAMYEMPMMMPCPQCGKLNEIEPEIAHDRCVWCHRSMDVSVYAKRLRQAEDVLALLPSLHVAIKRLREGSSALDGDILDSEIAEELGIVIARWHEYDARSPVQSGEDIRLSRLELQEIVDRQRRQIEDASYAMRTAASFTRNAISPLEHYQDRHGWSK